MNCFGSFCGFSRPLSVDSNGHRGLLSYAIRPNFDLAFLSMEHVRRNIKAGWLLPYAHANGASMVFLVVYFHTLTMSFPAAKDICRGLSAHKKPGV